MSFLFLQYFILTKYCRHSFIGVSSSLLVYRCQIYWENEDECSFRMEKSAVYFKTNSKMCTNFLVGADKEYMYSQISIVVTMVGSVHNNFPHLEVICCMTVSLWYQLSISSLC